MAMIEFILNRAIRTINPTTAAKVNSSKLVLWLKPGMLFIDSYKAICCRTSRLES